MKPSRAGGADPEEGIMGIEIPDEVWQLVRPPEAIPDDQTPHQGKPGGWQPRSLLTDELREAIRHHEYARAALSHVRNDLADARASKATPQRIVELEKAAEAARMVTADWETHVALIRRRQNGMGGRG
jgi:hypothetical protein